jgi:hypothetical protein
MRKKLINISDAQVEVKGLGNPNAAKGKLDYLAGLSKNEIHSLAGCKITAELLLAQTYPTDNFGVFIRSGSNWFKLYEVSPGDPFIEELKQDGVLIVKGPSPLQVEQAERRAKEEREKEEQAEQRRLERVRLIKERQQKELAKRNPNLLTVA